MLKTESLTTFKAVAEFQNFTKAANSLELTPMAVSKQISNLETQLKQPLFERTTRQVKLTEFGRAFLDHTNSVLGELQRLDEWVDSRQDTVDGTLKVVAQSAEVYQYTVYPWLSDFTEQYPNLTIELDVDEGAIDIDSNSYDIYWGVGAYLGEKRSNLISRLFWRGAYGIYASPDYLQKHGTPKSIQDLERHKLIGYLHNNPSNLLIINQRPNGDNQNLEYVFMESSIKAVGGIADIIDNGLGVATQPSDDKRIRQLLK
jgi:DNA-binding transcriptional LysR family regulator